MKKLILCGFLLIIVLMVAACQKADADSSDTDADKESGSVLDTETETETEVETETQFDYSVYEPDRDYVFLYNQSSNSANSFRVTARNSIGSLISVKKDCFVTKISAQTNERGAHGGEMDFCIWQWAGDYEATVATEPVYTKTLTDVLNSATAVVALPEYTIGEGEWYFEFRDGSGGIGVLTAQGEVPTNENADVSFVNGYQNGEVATRNNYMQSYVLYDKYDTTAQIVAVDPNGYTKLTEGKAHVIILAGQSNATGNSRIADLPADLQAKYATGYDNILINYNADNSRGVASGFVPVQLGQGRDATMFGPEVGLAEYLDTNYPGETFYIIKAAFSGTNLYCQWADAAGGVMSAYQGQTYNNFANFVQGALNQLKAEGLDPEIFAMLWMQGESDSMDFMIAGMPSWTIADADAYSDNLKSLVDRINDRFSEDMAPGGMAFIDAAICESSNWALCAIINQEKTDFADESQNHYYLDTNTPDIDTRDHNQDVAHYDADDMIELGHLFGEGVGQVLTNAGHAAD